MIFISPEQMFSFWNGPHKWPMWNDCSRHRVSYEMIQWRERPGPHISRKNKSKCFSFIVMWARRASTALYRPPIGNSIGLNSTRLDQKKKKKERENRHSLPKHLELKKQFHKAVMKNRGMIFILFFYPCTFNNSGTLGQHGSKELAHTVSNHHLERHKNKVWAQAAVRGK